MSQQIMSWQQLLSSQRLQGMSRHGIDDVGRSPFHKDHDRVVFSGSFRRMGRKTQVHPLAENDHIHTRLTHSLEVSCVGRSLGMMVADSLQHHLPDNISPADLGVIVQSACLAHDIGNPPFGHAGEYAIRDWFLQAEKQGRLDGLTPEQKADLITFEGNAQGFRMVTQVEYNQFAGGMKLTYATLGTFLKYPWTATYASSPDNTKSAGKFSCYQTELPMLQETAKALGLIQLADQRWCRHPLVYLVEAADDLCYALLDLEDGLEMEILAYQEVEGLLLQIAGSEPEGYRRLAKASNRRRVAALRGAAMEQVVAAVSKAFVEHQEELLAGRFNRDLIDACPPDIAQGVAQAKRMAQQRIFDHPRKAKLEIGAYTTLGVLLENFCGAVDELSLLKETGSDAPLSFKHKRVLSLIGENIPDTGWSRYEAYRRVLDFIGGMTDNYAVDLAQEMGGRLNG
ncbi:deoxyguanosinetriphosphate triphosphohydrolase [Oceanospirillum linum]|uniref:Deoxyguanosinetriphosphate triphosphohydrolase n=1 Tax=Oceanospirillum linum TaxID=966 RepID=A0A1T1HBT7_OCELI|nr:deoxyguanosinetriphosphate triphosphohydrolase [Oceanospirillum linum]OOV87311.1 deoxyguanosinetriphosphate triphosphohydrolase [Oceanospirillum linum]SEF81073.1 dGTPase [Oleiphilus messinensis]SMP18988.1 dGTPase [Oceanospirillum linum]